MNIRHKTWIAIAVEIGSLAALACIFIRGGPVLVGWVLIGVCDVASVCAMYFITKWWDELTRG